LLAYNVPPLTSGQLYLPPTGQQANICQWYVALDNVIALPTDTACGARPSTTPYSVVVPNVKARRLPHSPHGHRIVLNKT
jgi:hypothetical protein